MLINNKLIFPAFIGQIVIVNRKIYIALSLNPNDWKEITNV